MSDPWIVDIKGSHKGGEIAVLRQSNCHGQASYGWSGDDKIIVHAVHTLYDQHGLNQDVWAFAIRQAEQECKTLNTRSEK